MIAIFIFDQICGLEAFLPVSGNCHVCLNSNLMIPSRIRLYRIPFSRREKPLIVATIPQLSRCRTLREPPH